MSTRWDGKRVRRELHGVLGVGDRLQGIDRPACRAAGEALAAQRRDGPVQRATVEVLGQLVEHVVGGVAGVAPTLVQLMGEVRLRQDRGRGGCLHQRPSRARRTRSRSSRRWSRCGTRCSRHAPRRPRARSSGIGCVPAGSDVWSGCTTMEGLKSAADSTAYSWLKYAPMSRRRASEIDPGSTSRWAMSLNRSSKVPARSRCRPANSAMACPSARSTCSSVRASTRSSTAEAREKPWMSISWPGRNNLVTTRVGSGRRMTPVLVTSPSVTRPSTSPSVTACPSVAPARRSPRSHERGTARKLQGRQRRERGLGPLVQVDPGRVQPIGAASGHRSYSVSPTSFAPRNHSAHSCTASIQRGSPVASWARQHASARALTSIGCWSKPGSRRPAPAPPRGSRRCAHRGSAGRAATAAGQRRGPAGHRHSVRARSR